MASIRGSIYFLLFSFLMEKALCYLTTTKEPERRPFITSDNIPPFPPSNETNSDILASQDLPKDLDNTSDELKVTPDNTTTTDKHTGADMEERGSFNHLTNQYPIRSKPVYRQLNGLNILMNNYEADSTQDPTIQDRHQRSPNDEDSFGSNTILFSSNRGRQRNQALGHKGSTTTEATPSISSNRRINQLLDTPASTVRDKGIRGSVNQPIIGDNSISRQYNEPGYQQINNQDKFPFDVKHKGSSGSVNQPIGDNNRGRQYNKQGYQQQNLQDRFPFDDRVKYTSGPIGSNNRHKEYSDGDLQRNTQNGLPYDASRIASNNRQTSQQNIFSVHGGRHNDILGSINLQNSSPYKDDHITCNRRGVCNTVTPKDVFPSTYKLIEQFSSDQYEMTMCFIEVIYVTEIDLSETLLVSREFLWTIETMDHRDTLDDVSCSNLLDNINNPPVELVNTERLEGRIVKEYRIKHCGSGNIFKHEYSTWPNDDRRMIQVTISNTSLLQCQRQQDTNIREQLYTTTLNPLTYRSTLDENRNTYVTEMPKPSSVELPTSGPGETIDATMVTPGPPVVQAQRGVVQFDDDSGESSEERMKDYMKIIIDCVMKNKNLKGMMCPHSLIQLLAVTIISGQNSQRYNCNTAGYYQYEDSECRKYYMCYQMPYANTEIWYKTFYTCPYSFVFNPTSSSCEQTASCIDNICLGKLSGETMADPNALNRVYQIVAHASKGLEIQPFICEKPGYFENPSDTSCRTFYQCITFLEGLIPVAFTCPIFTNFDPELQICSLSYACPANKSLITAARSSNSPKMSLQNDYPVDPNMEVIRSCTPFECASEGIFEDPDTCGKYYVCSKFFKSYVVTHNPCPVFAGFDPVYRMCSFAKTCLPPIKGCIPQDQRYKEETCIQVDYPDYFQCRRPGYFRNFNDLTCETYHVCKATDGGVFSKQTYRCPSGSSFNPHVKKCDTNYICPCKDTSNETATNVSEISSDTTRLEENNGEVIKDYETPLETSKVLSDQDELTYMSFIMANKSGLSYNDGGRYAQVNLPEKSSSEAGILSEFSFESLHIDSNSTNLSKCNPISAENFECGSAGRFRDSGDVTCQSYFLCNLLRNGSFLKTRYVCPGSASFNPNLGACDINYKCPCEDDGQRVTTSKEDVCLYEKDVDYFSCNEKGRFENLNDLTCQSYFLCNLLRNGSFVMSKYMCPRGSYFHPKLGVCSTQYICPCSSPTATTHSIPSTGETSVMTTQAPLTTERACKYEEISENFNCIGKGRYENLNDLTCQSYYLCNLLRNGSFVRTNYSCPSGSRFNPSSSVCDIQYVCPCEIYTTTLPSSTTDKSNQSTTIPNETTEAPDCNYQKNPEYFSCSRKGGFENLNDLDCESYFLCNLLRNGSFLKTKYLCPKGSYFNPALSMCSKSYGCPCNSYITTASTNTAAKETTEQGTTTAERYCRYEDNPEYFTCTEKGRFKNLNDMTCQSYYLCNLLRNGSYARTRYLCPNGSRFNPSLGICDKKYQCPCETHITTTSPSITDQTRSSTTPESRTTEPDGLTTTESTMCDYQQDPDYFSCTRKGRFQNLNDLDCESYFLCNLLRNGSFLKTKYVCPKGSYFNPSLSICSKTYICPCSSSSSAPSTDVSSTLTQETTTTNSVTTTTTAERNSRHEDDPDYFTCPQKGRFEDLNDITCQNYYLCNILNNGSFIKTRYSCPKGSRFNPTLGVCDTIYICPCETNATTVLPSTTDLPSATTENAITEHDDPMTTESSVCDYQQDPEYFDCTKKGRFENLNDLDCESYFLCNLLGNGSFLKTKYSCPKGSYFDPRLSICSKSYICPCNSHATTEDTTEITSVTATTAKKRCRYEHDPEYFNCVAKGRFEDLNDLTCQSYYLCNFLQNGSFIKTSYSCPKGARFNPSLGVCDTLYICPCEASIITNTTDLSTYSTTTATEGSTTTEEIVCDYREDPEYFNCMKTGRFENLNDLDCESYFLCNLLRNGSFLKTKYSCPKASYFNPALGICSKNYICPCNSRIMTQSSPVFSTVTENTNDTPTTVVPTSSTASSNRTTDADDSQITESVACDYQKDPEYFACTKKGRFENLNDVACESYFLCNQLRNGSFLKTKYSCPKGSYFNPTLSICSTKYVCPCSSRITTESSNEYNGTTEAETTSCLTTASTKIACVYQENPDYFNCTTSGSFANHNDLTCQTFFICSSLNDGTFFKAKYSCPGSLFNPNLGLCDSNFSCPCALPTTSADITVSNPSATSTRNEDLRPLDKTSSPVPS
nr:unnamed protein product [Callosobruchus analis]